MPIEIELGIELFKDLIFPVFKAATGFAKEKYAATDPFGKATRKYIGGLIERYNNVKVLGMREPTPLKELYVRANILEKISVRAGLRAEELAEFFDFDRRAFGKKSETVDGEIIVNRLQKFIVLGKPGAGKTTYLKFLALMMLDPESKIKQRRLPIFITLREWADERMPLDEFIQKQFDICGFPDARLFVERLLGDGKCLVLFDGLDEVSQEANQDDIIRQIRNFTDKYTDNQFVISFRVAKYNHWFERFTDVEMADFNEQQMETFIKKWFSGKPKIAAECWVRLKISPQLLELASVPLLLTLLCLTFNPKKREFPQRRSSIYKQAVRQLLEEWDEKRPGGRVKRTQIYQELTVELKEEMFAEIAYRTFSNNLYFIDEDLLIKMIEVFLKKQPEFEGSKIRISGRKVLNELVEHHSILVEHVQGVYSFAHLTFHEYFVAKYITEQQWKKHQNYEKDIEKQVVENYLLSNNWYDIFVLTSEMFENPDYLLLLVQSKIIELSKNPSIDALLNCINKELSPSMNKPNDGKEITRRALCLFLLFEGDLLFEIVQVIDNLTEKIISKFIFECISNQILSEPEIIKIIGKNWQPFRWEDHQETFNKFEHTLFSGEGIKFEPHSKLINDLSSLFEIDKYEIVKNNSDLEFDSKFLHHFFYANLLLLRMIQKSNSLFLSTRERLINEMFLPKEDLEAGLAGKD